MVLRKGRISNVKNRARGMDLQGRTINLPDPNVTLSADSHRVLHFHINLGYATSVIFVKREGSGITVLTHYTGGSM